MCSLFISIPDYNQICVHQNYTYVVRRIYFVLRWLIVCPALTEKEYNCEIEFRGRKETKNSLSTHVV